MPEGINLFLADAPLTLREFMTQEEVPLASIFREVLGFLVGRSDVVVFGAHAVNAYCEPERMTQEVDLLSTQAIELAEQLRARLAEKLHIAVRVREIVADHGVRIYQIRNGHTAALAGISESQGRGRDRARQIAPSECFGSCRLPLAGDRPYTDHTGR
ncbi:MAG: hypothetical protein WCI05_05875 [Myxococcales bacterium]